MNQSQKKLAKRGSNDMRLLFALLPFLVAITPCMTMSDTEQKQLATSLVEKETETDKKLVENASTQELISFNYKDEELVNVINYLATKKGVNILFPTKENEKVIGKLSWTLDKKVTIDEAWTLLQTILSIAGYNLIPRLTYNEIVKTTPAISREAVPLYIGVPFEQLPATDARIRYMYYLSNIKSEEEGSENEISTILKAWLPTSASFKLDTPSNALIIMAQSNDIRAVMPVITSLDRPGFQEKMEIIYLRHTNAKAIADLFNTKIIPSNDTNRYRLDTKKQTDATYFSKHLRIIANERRNSLIILGRTQGIDRVREFIKNYIDIEHDSGKSILHVYQLQYLSAPAFAKVLENILQQKETGGLEQSTGAQQKATGPQRYFGEVIIATDSPPETTNAATDAETGEQEDKIAKYYGGNKLIIACRNDDWKRIKALIEKLDQASPQVLIEVLIADLTLDDTKALGAAFRNPQKIPMPGETAFQSAQLNPGVMPDSFSNPETIGLIENKDGSVKAASDLLRNFGIKDGKRIDGSEFNIAGSLPPGSTVFSLSDNSGKTFGIAQILKVLDHRKVLSHPHVLSTSDKTAVIEIAEIRKLQGPASGSSGNTTVLTRENISAKLTVEITPRISISEIKENSVSLKVKIDIDQFKSLTDNTRITRNVTTNVTVNTGDIVALGGLLRSNETDETRETPILGQLPLIGWLFKNRSKVKQRTNLTVFISPTVIQPRLREGVGQYTKDYLNLAREWSASGGMFDSLKDPITRWFFADEKSPTEKFTQAFLKNDIRFQDLPAPSERVKKGYYVDNKKADHEIDQNREKTVVVAQHKDDQSDQLKKLLKDVDNPFKKLEPVQLADNSPAPSDQAIAPSKRRRQRK